jgi:hypothetical protein
MVFNIACGSPVIYDIFFHAHSISQNIKHSNHMFRKMTLLLVNHGKVNLNILQIFNMYDNINILKN